MQIVKRFSSVQYFRLQSSVTMEACTMLTITDRRSCWSLLILGRPVACRLYGFKIPAADSLSLQTLWMLSFIVSLCFLMRSVALFNLKLTDHIGLRLC